MSHKLNELEREMVTSIMSLLADCDPSVDEAITALLTPILLSLKGEDTEGEVFRLESKTHSIVVSRLPEPVTTH